MPDSPATEADFDLGRAALLEITAEATIGEPAGSVDEGDGVISVYFDTTMVGYKGWRWTVSIAHIDGGEPSVLEAELTPGETALLSPPWVPWADRLAEHKASQGEQDAVDPDSDSDDRDSDDDDDDFDDDDVSDDDFDGVDIDELEEGPADDDVSVERESAPAVGVEQPEQAKNEPDDAGPEKPRRSRRKKKDDD